MVTVHGYLRVFQAEGFLAISRR